MGLIDIKFGTLEKVAEGYIPIKSEKDELSLDEFNTALQTNARRKDLTINVHYIAQERKYKFKIYTKK